MGNIIRGDVDHIFSYNTRQQVNILDRVLGMTFISINVVVLAYVICYDLILNKGYLQYEAARGIVATSTAGDAYAVSGGKAHGQRYFSAEEITGPPNLENGNVFVATRVRVSKQKRGVCEDLQRKCFDDSDCAAGHNAECSDSGYCVEPSWCNVPGVEPMLFDLPTAGHLIWAKTSMQYIQLKPDKIFHTDLTRPIRYPEPGYNTFSVRDLLDLCHPPVRYEEISLLGAAIEVQFQYKCDVDAEECQPLVKARRLDTLFDPEDIGFNYDHLVYSGTDERELNEVRGIRFYMKATGVGEKMSLTHIVMKISTGLALLSTATLLTDTLMLNILPRKDKYYARKYMESEDFSEYFEKQDQNSGGSGGWAGWFGGGKNKPKDEIEFGNDTDDGEDSDIESSERKD